VVHFWKTARSVQGCQIIGICTLANIIIIQEMPVPSSILAHAENMDEAPPANFEYLFAVTCSWMESGNRIEKIDLFSRP
jgi:hypothetical protein